jgi:hypothetical protein
VVCEPIAVDLGKVCRPLEDPCEMPPKPAGGNQRTPSAGYEGEQATTDDTDEGRAEKCWGMLRGDVVGVDLWLRHHEDLAQGQRSLLRSGCGDAGGCEYTRVRENPCVYAEVDVTNRTCDDDTEWETWVSAFYERYRLFIAEIRGVLAKGLDAIVHYLHKHPPYRLCFLEEFVCCLRETEKPNAPRNIGQPGVYSTIGFWIYYDWLLHQLECPCQGCRPDRGVPLARVLVRRPDERDGKCRVLFIDAGSPPRRWLRKDPCRPLPRGAIDLAPYLWQPRGVLGDLRRMGVAVKDTVEKQGWIDERAAYILAGRTREELFVQPDQQQGVIAHVVRDPFDCERVAAFSLVTP